MKISSRQRGQCFSCGEWVWKKAPDGSLHPLPTLREGYLFCNDNQLAKICVCRDCEEILQDGGKSMMEYCLKVFIKDFNGNPQLTNPTKYENSREHWTQKGINILVPWVS